MIMIITIIIQITRKKAIITITLIISNDDYGDKYYIPIVLSKYHQSLNYYYSYHCDDRNVQQSKLRWMALIPV